MDKEKELIITLEDNTELLCHILLTYHSDETGFDYVIFEMPDEEVSAARYDEAAGLISDIETDEEWELINDVLEDYYDSLEELEDEE